MCVFVIYIYIYTHNIQTSLSEPQERSLYHSEAQRRTVRVPHPRYAWPRRLAMRVLTVCYGQFPKFNLEQRAQPLGALNRLRAC